MNKNNKDALCGKAYAARIVDALEKLYTKAECSLESAGEPWRLLVMARLSAQCTDARVNIVCQELFSQYPTAEKMASAQLEEIEKLVYSCGFYRHKASDIKEFSATVAKTGVPDTMEGLLALPGIGRKIANLILGDVYGKPAIIADTHCIRISGRLGMSDGKSPESVERQLLAVVEPEKQSDFCHRLVLFGREYCRAKNPACDTCPISEICKFRISQSDEKAKRG